MFYYYHHIGDFRAASAFLPAKLQYAYLKLLWVYYDTEQPLPNDPAKLAMWSGVSQDQALLIVDEFFDLNDDHWHHARCDEVIGKYNRHQVASSKGGKKRAANAAAKRQGPLKAPSSEAQATINQKPETNNKEKDTTSSSPAGPTKAPGKVPIQAIVDAWNTHSIAHGMIQCIKITTTIRGQLRQRWSDLDTLEKWNNFFDHIGMNDFLAGRAAPGVGRSKPFRSSLLWVTKETNFAKIAQGEYD